MAQLSKRTKKNRDAILEVLQNGGTISTASKCSGVGRSTINDWKRDDPEFARDFQSAFEDGTDSLIAIARERALRDHSMSSNVMLMFLIKQRDPSFRENHQVQVQVENNLNQLFTALRESAKAPRT